MELYRERGYEQTTVAEIADRAGLTARTFFRYFADKREVLFAGSDAMGERLIVALDAAPATDAPFDLVVAALDQVCRLIGGEREYSRTRQEVIVANAELRERELIKLASWAQALAEGLRRREVAEPAASLAAETGVAVFRVAFDRWLAGPAGATLADTLHETVTQMRTVTATG